MQLPEWASFLRSVGHAAAAHKREPHRLIAGIVVPTRSFAAGFVALGAVQERLASARPQATASEHFAAISALPSGSPLTVQISGRKYKATLVGYDTRNGQEGINVRYEKDKMQAFLPAGQCDRVTTGSLGKDTLAKRPRIADAAKHSWDAAFVETALGVEDANQFARQDDFAALIIGRLSNLRYELEEAAFGVESNSKVISGHIEDLIRTKKFADDPEGETFRTEVMSDRARELDQDIAALNPPVVIFDGARAFEKHYWSWPDASWVVILDQSDHAADDGAAIFNSLYAQRVNDSDPTTALLVPAGVEFTSFLGKRS